MSAGLKLVTSDNLKTRIILKPIYVQPWFPEAMYFNITPSTNVTISLKLSSNPFSNPNFLSTRQHWLGMDGK